MERTAIRAFALTTLLAAVCAAQAQECKNRGDLDAMYCDENGAMVRVGQNVSLGQLIGYSGNTGYSSGPHLHFCVQINSNGRLVSIPFRMVGPNGFLPLPGH